MKTDFYKHKLFDPIRIGFSKALNLGTGAFSKCALSPAPVFTGYNGLSFLVTPKQVRQGFTF